MKKKNTIIAFYKCLYPIKINISKKNSLQNKIKKILKK
jgi:hypothetical protein